MRVALLLAAALACASAMPIPQPGAGGKQWALLIAGSSGWGNYRHQADIYHAYQIVKAGGIPDENIVVMHADDIAHSLHNPKKGTVINKPDGHDVYKGVPKDYTGLHVNAHNFLHVLKGNSSALTGGSGKVIASGPEDTVFVYFADHGGPGILGMPTFIVPHVLYGKDLVEALKDKAAAKGFKQMVFYVEACESGSIFNGTLPDNIKIYATTAANGEESSWGTYCPGMNPPPPKGYNTCLGDLYSISWMEDTDAHARATETLEAQYTRVKNRVSQNGTYTQGSHVQQFGELDIDPEDLSVFLGSAGPSLTVSPPATMDAVDNRDAELIFLRQQIEHAASEEDRAQALADMAKTLHERELANSQTAAIVQSLVGRAQAATVATSARTPLVDDWECLRTGFDTFLTSCGPFASQYAFKHSRSFANLCNAGIASDKIVEATLAVCKPSA